MSDELDRSAVQLRRRALAFLAATPIDARVVVRVRDCGGARDALGVLVDRTADTCTVRTRRGDVTIALQDVIAAKPVPPPPEPRPRRQP